MLPKWHALLGFLFAYVIYWFTAITLFQASLIFLSSIFIDIDHYLWHIIKNKDHNLKNAYLFLKNKQRWKRKLMIFHTIEFHILILLLSLIYLPFVYIFIGMIFHSILDIIELAYEKRLKVRVFSLLELFKK
jgi:hypothetical protein